MRLFTVDCFLLCFCFIFILFLKHISFNQNTQKWHLMVFTREKKIKSNSIRFPMRARAHTHTFILYMVFTYTFFIEQTNNLRSRVALKMHFVHNNIKQYWIRKMKSVFLTFDFNVSRCFNTYDALVIFVYLIRLSCARAKVEYCKFS